MYRKRAERLDHLAHLLTDGGFLRLKEAAESLGVSEMTVRRDLATGDGRFSYLGGYIAAGPESPGGMGYILNREQETNTELKRAASRAALDLIRPEDTLFIDCGTTTPHLARLLPHDTGLTVICYSMNVAQILCRKPGIRVILLGGLYHGSSAAFSSPEALETLRRMRINLALLSAGGVHAEGGVSCSNFFEVAIKTLAMENAQSRALLVDSTKFGLVKPEWFSDLADYDHICTDEHFDPEGPLAPYIAGASVHRGPVSAQQP
ncbi:DeoR/GlpR family DNA-binding transcription regulator [Tropicimonas isoalkanivorans]|uniref:Transcriptional regulator, DeoR family n=1 Tax=Tropicimonas isoalkanivorans TaxID=441112 RepID=A0A1I1Q2E1_9RHOB|nr:DeoR/GlpR family DNA-binding transcription regulator [Tropicimonas isoalkanivorans]SFD16306.1 transcriptional regulator, DeoR family [Tropicimonas isoalkanivorans]